MSQHSLKPIIPLALIMSFRMLGLFLILPVFTLYAARIPGATPTLIGLALGIYGLTQAALQIPFGTLSDHFGRKPIIVIGLGLFALGSFVAASSHNMTTLILGRALQGAGAVGSTIMALVADLTRDEHRSKAMAIVGLSIAAAFSVAMALGPSLDAWLHLSGVFGLTGILALLGIGLLFRVPTPTILTPTKTLAPMKQRLGLLIKNPQLARLNIGICCLHALLTAAFLSIPRTLSLQLHLSAHGQTYFYLGVLLSAMCLSFPCIFIGETKRILKPMFVGAVFILMSTLLLIAFEAHSIALFFLYLMAFFAAFTFLEACLPSLVSKIAPLEYKGMAMGLYSSSQFFGIFLGGTLGGLCLAHAGSWAVCVFAAAVALIWLLLIITMDQPPYLSTQFFELPARLNAPAQDLQNSLLNLAGVSQVIISTQEQLIYIKYDKQKTPAKDLLHTIKTVTLGD